MIVSYISYLQRELIFAPAHVYDFEHNLFFNVVIFEGNKCLLLTLC